MISSDVIVVGAGAAGLTAAFHLQQAGLAVTVLEADNHRIGGRLRKDETLADFPLDVGGAWIHGDPAQLLNPILDQGDVAAALPTVRHNALSMYQVWDGEQFYTDPILDDDADNLNDHKWVNATWFDFFHEQVASRLEPDTIVLGCPVTEIDYSNDDAVVTKCANGDTYEATYVIVTVSLQILQNRDLITFVPELPAAYRDAMDAFQMAPGLKVFLEFDRTFYPEAFYNEQDYTDYSDRLSSPNFAERLFWDETYGQTTSKHILGCFAYGAIVEDEYLDLPNSDPVLVDKLLAELDVLFDGQASQHYLQRSVVQIWSSDDEPYVQTAYTRWVDGGQAAPIRVLQTPLQSRLLFAGEALPVDGQSWGFAHGAAFSGKEAARKIAEIAALGTVAPSLEASDTAVPSTVAPSTEIAVPSTESEATGTFAPSPPDVSSASLFSQSNFWTMTIATMVAFYLVASPGG